MRTQHLNRAGQGKRQDKQKVNSFAFFSQALSPYTYCSSSPTKEREETMMTMVVTTKGGINDNNVDCYHEEGGGYS